MTRNAAIWYFLTFALTNVALAVASVVIANRRLPDLIEPLHVQFINLACGVLLGIAILIALRRQRSADPLPIWTFFAAQVPALISFFMLGMRGLGIQSLTPIICASLVQGAVLLPAVARSGR